MPRLALSALVSLGCALSSFSLASGQVPEGYDDFEAFETKAKQLAESPLVTLTELAQTAEGRGVVLLTVTTPDDCEPPRRGKSCPDRPAVLVLGSVEGDNLVGGHLAMAMVDALVERHDEHPELLEAITFYVLPRPSPDACERAFATPLVQSAVNSRPMDDDRDGAIDEDPAEDLNGDGLITMMRVADPAGGYRTHPDDPRVMIEADPVRGEAGEYRLLTEGRDNDGDDRWNEDGPGGVAFDRNFTFRYPYFEPGAGPHQVSEPETRAIAEFAYDHPSIFAVCSISGVDNLNHPWKPKPSEGRIKESVQSGDAKYLNRIVERYKELADPKGAPAASGSEGAFAPWAYHHFGRWSIATRGWWAPPAEKAPEEKKAKEEKDEASDEAEEDEGASEDAEDDTSEEANSDEKQDVPGKKEKPDPRGEDDRDTLRWFDEVGVEGFVEWEEIEHPDFPGKRVEVGGFKPYARSHPPVERLKPAPLVELLIELAEKRAAVEFVSARAEPLGGGVVRITAEVANKGSLPTATEMGRIAGAVRRLEVELTGPEDMQVLDGPQRQDLGVLAPGKVAERSWLVLLGEGPGIEKLSLRAGEPSVGYATAEPEALAEGEPQP